MCDLLYRIPPEHHQAGGAAMTEGEWDLQDVVFMAIGIIAFIILGTGAAIFIHIYMAGAP